MSSFGNKKESSLIIQIISSNKNTVKRAINNGAYISSSEIDVVEDLEKEGYVRESSPNKFTITAKGIFFVERNIRGIDDSRYESWLDSKYLNFEQEPLTDKNRVILLSLFAARCFSEGNSATYSDESSLQAFMSLLVESNSFLYNHGLIKEDALDSKDAKSKTTISSILGQIDKLPSSSGLLFVAKDKRYYLDVIKNQNIDRASIKLLTKIILGEKIDLESVNDLKKFCNNSYMKYGYIFKSGKSSFNGSMFQFELESAMDDSIF